MTRISTPLDRYLCEHDIKGGDFAARVGVLETQISKIRRGRARPTLEQAIAIARETGGAVPVEAWVAGEGYETQDAAE